MALPVRALVFDAYGTLFDLLAVRTRAEELFPGKGTELSQIWRAKQLEYSWLRTLMGRLRKFLENHRRRSQLQLPQSATLL
jgi:2-haloacid dehalogenase